MMQQDQNYFSFDIIGFIKLIWSRKWLLALSCTVAGILTYVFTGPNFITPLYKATVIFYPTSNANMSSTMLTEPGTQGYRITEFGSEEDAEQLLQILTSDALRNKVIIRYQLAGHYGLDTSQKVSMLAMRTLFGKNYSVKQTEYKAIQVSVFDKDPKLAAEMANYIANLADFEKTDIQKAKALQAFKIVEQEYLAQVNRMKGMDSILLSLREKGVYDYFEQSSQLNEALTSNSIKLQQEQAILKVYEENKESIPDSLLIRTRARVNGYQAAIKSIKPLLEEIKKHGGEYLNNINNLELERKKLLSLKTRYESAKIDFEESLPQKFVINAAEEPEIPSTPRRLLTTAIVMVSTFIFALLLLALMDVFPSIVQRFRD